MTPDEGGSKTPCVQGMQLLCFSKTSNCNAFIQIVDKEMVLPGENVTLELQMLKPMVLEDGQNFTIKDNNNTIGTGELKGIRVDDINDTLAGKITKLNLNMTVDEEELMNLNMIEQFEIMQVDGNTDDAVEGSDGLNLCKQILDRLLKNECDQFEILSFGNKFQVDLQKESSFSRQKYLLQKHIIECIIREDRNDYYARLLEETVGLCQLRRPQGYHCCLAGCCFKADRHKNYVQHLQKVHSNFHKLACKYKHECKREFSNIPDLIDHIRQSHSKLEIIKHHPPKHPPNIIVSVKCDFVRCGGKQFPDLKQLMKHWNVDHAKESRECIFDQCSKHFSPNSASRKHFRTEHVAKNNTRLKSKYLVEPIADQVAGLDEDEAASVEGASGGAGEAATCEDLDIYEEGDIEYLENGDETDHEEPVLGSDYFIKAYADFCNRMCHIKYVPHRTMQEITSEYLSQSLKSVEHRGKKLREALGKLPNVSEEQIDEIVHNTVLDDQMLKAQQQLDTNYKRSKYIQQNFKYIEPQEIILNKEEVDMGMAKECFHYVSVVDSLKNLLEDETFINVLEKEREVRERRKEVISDVKDGNVFKEVEFFKQNPGSLASIFYSDALEIVNPLGAAKGKHKVVNVFWTLGDIPKEQRSQIDRMMLALIVKEKYLKKYGYSVIYKVLLDDLKKLEAGILIDKPVPRLVKCGILLHAGDNLESHSVGGFSRCFSSMDICRFCHIQYTDLREHIHDLDGDDVHEYWTVEGYDDICDSLESNLDGVLPEAVDTISINDLEQHLFDEYEEPSSEEEVDNNGSLDVTEDESDLDEEENLGTRNKFGLRERCVFNVLDSFHAVYSFPPDLLHDLYEGVVAQDLCGCIKILSMKGFFTIKEYNEALQNHHYKSYEMNDRPQPLIKPKAMKLSGKAVSIWLHIRSFGMIVQRFEISAEDEVLSLCLDLAEITERLSANEFRLHEIDICEEKIVHYLDNRKKVFGEFPDLLGSSKPKHHFLVHYKDAIRLFGPPLSYWTGRFESKHRIAKGTAEGAKNFKNITATLSIRQQMRMASQYYGGLFDTDSVRVTGSVTTKEDAQELGAEFMCPGDVLCSKLVFHSQEYKTSDLVVVKARDSNFLEVGIIQTIVVKPRKVIFVLKIFEAERNRYKFFVSKAASERPMSLDPLDLADFKPLVRYGTGQKFKFYLHHHISYSHD